MSRCYPFPQPFIGKPLIASIKLQEGQTTKDKKEKKRKRKEKKDKANVEPVVNFQYLGKSQENKYEEKSLFDQHSRKTTKDVSEHMEGSTLTEEHELPCCIKYKYDSPESSQDSNKRRKLVSSASGHNKPGTILRIKLSSLRQRDAEPPLPSSRKTEPVLLLQRDAEPPLPSSRKTEPELLLPSSRQRNPQLPSTLQPAGVTTVVALNKLEQVVHEHPAAIEQPCSSGRDIETGFNQEAAVTLHRRTSGSKRIGKRTWQREQFRDLIVNWNPPSLQLESGDAGGEEDWLCGAPKRHSSLYSDEGKATTEVSSVSYMSSSQQPRACYLPEFDMYQLPYEVPF